MGWTKSVKQQQQQKTRYLHSAHDYCLTRSGMTNKRWKYSKV